MREIKSHKGGRTANIPHSRCTPETRQKYEQILKRTGETGADLLERLIVQEWDRLFPPDGYIIRGLTDIEPRDQMLYFTGEGWEPAHYPADAKLYKHKVNAEKVARGLPLGNTTHEVVPYYKFLDQEEDAT